jgi:hypothetical protein
LLGAGRISFVRCFHLPFPDHMHHFDAGLYDAGASKILETHRRPGDAFDRPVILLYEFRYLTWRTLIGVSLSALILWMAARLASLLSMVTVSGTPFWPIAFSK